MSKQFTEEEFRTYINQRWGVLAPRTVAQIWTWLTRGDGAAIYENHEMGNPEAGNPQIVSYGSPSAQIEADEPPELLPDIGNQINWRYVLVGTFRKNQQRIGLVHDE